MGDVLYDDEPVRSWSSANPDGTNQLNAVSCPSTGLCVAVDAVGNAVISTAPFSGGTWTVTPIDAGHDLDGVSCAPGSATCVAVDFGGRFISATNPSGGTGAWTPAAADGGHIVSGISCASATLCVAVDDVGDIVTSTSPASGAWNISRR